MRKVVKDAVRCSECGKIEKHAEEDIFCDNCEKKLVEYDNYRGYPFNISPVGCNSYERLEFCSTKCGLEWITKNGIDFINKNEDEMKHGFFSIYLFQNDIVNLKEFLCKKPTGGMALKGGEGREFK